MVEQRRSTKEFPYNAVSPFQAVRISSILWKTIEILSCLSQTFQQPRSPNASGALDEEAACRMFVQELKAPPGPELSKISSPTDFVATAAANEIPSLCSPESSTPPAERPGESESIPRGQPRPDLGEEATEREGSPALWPTRQNRLRGKHRRSNNRKREINDRG